MNDNVKDVTYDTLQLQGESSLGVRDLNDDIA